jgi:hypothetical protein
MIVVLMSVDQGESRNALAVRKVTTSIALDPLCSIRLGSAALGMALQAD